MSARDGLAIKPSDLFVRAAVAKVRTRTPTLVGLAWIVKKSNLRVNLKPVLRLFRAGLANHHRGGNWLHLLSYIMM